MFYKFRPINKWFIESIVQNTLYIPDRKQLNDPFDCQLDIHKLLSHALEHSTPSTRGFISKFKENENFLQIWEQTMASVSIYSFSIKEDNIKVLQEPLMWSHYADGHKGACVEYAIPDEHYKTTIQSDIDFFAHGRVEYAGDANAIAGKVNNLPLRIDEFTEGLVRTYLLSKHNSWRYENEGRFIFKKSKEITIPRGSIKSIYFGINTHPKDIELIIKIINKFSTPEPNLFKAKKGVIPYTIEFEKI
jgi:Protein of unknown function (DUF2971)